MCLLRFESLLTYSCFSLPVGFKVEGDSVTEQNAAEGNEVEPEGGKEGVNYCVEPAVDPSRPGEVIRIDVDIPRPRLRSSLSMRLGSCIHSVNVLLLSLGLCLYTNTTVALFDVFRHIVLPLSWYFNKVAVNLVAGTGGCSALEQHHCAQLARFAVVELDLAVRHQVSHHLLVHGHEEKVIEVSDDD